MLQGWAMTNLSHGGRLALIRSVLQATPLHLLQVIHRPKFVLTTIERIFNGFFRGSYNRRRHIHWSSWAKACFPVAEGGLGVRSLEKLCSGLFYEAVVAVSEQVILMVGIFAWLLCRNLHRTIVPYNRNHSPIWHRLCRISDVAEPFIFWTLVFLWQLFQDRIPVDARMKQKGFSFPSKCQCCEAEETISHLFVESMAVQGVWQHFAALFGLCLSDTGSLTHMVHFLRYSTPFHSDLHIRTLLPFLILWFTWTQ
ncbi:UNVERIFIED_CONTAM: hypothetical protein Sradi_4133400 [Sesamum radiatum]|uniref:Reverse transcriptase zinc-binding domain-containing protein n=1 Tax=Sesamum radiatum TaxID=300843 RepID=A0AAW2P442_SESRA